MSRIKLPGPPAPKMSKAFEKAVAQKMTPGPGPHPGLGGLGKAEDDKINPKTNRPYWAGVPKVKKMKRV